MILFRLHYTRDQLPRSVTLPAADPLDIPSQASAWLHRSLTYYKDTTLLSITNVRPCVDTREQFIQACLPLASLD